jgi:hypothetical protein
MEILLCDDGYLRTLPARNGGLRIEGCVLEPGKIMFLVAQI